MDKEKYNQMNSDLKKSDEMRKRENEHNKNLVDMFVSPQPEADRPMQIPAVR